MTIDEVIIAFDKGLRTLAAEAPSVRPSPAAGVEDRFLADDEKRLSIGLMRVNHIGEVCAQALYQGQSLTCRTPYLRLALQEAASEETEHLAWTAQRIRELGGGTSLLAPAFYIGALGLGALAGQLGDRWNLGFLAETERQVEVHLAGHLARLPVSDVKSRAIVHQMRVDEIQHAEMAVRLGAADLPRYAKMAMKLAARVMTTTVPHI